jgi:hypothetical protein
MIASARLSALGTNIFSLFAVNGAQCRTHARTGDASAGIMTLSSMMRADRCALF